MSDVVALNDFLSTGLALGFYITLLIFTFYSLFLAYHWFSYGTKKSTGMIALAVYLLGSAPFFIIMAIAL